MLTSYHVHSKFSDGENTIQEIVNAGVSAHLDELGISDHYALLSGNRTVPWSMKLDSLPQYFEEISAAKESVKDKLVVRYGLEADFDPDAVNELRDVLQSHPFDYVIGSIHFVNGFPIDELKDYWDQLAESERNDMICEYWNRIAALANCGLFNFAGHLDLYKKFGYLPTVDTSKEMRNALDEIAKSGIAVELNTSGWYKDIKEAYPSQIILQECRKRSIPVLITADAHNIANLTRAYDRAASLLKGIGYNQLTAFANRKPHTTALSD